MMAGLIAEVWLVLPVQKQVGLQRMHSKAGAHSRSWYRLSSSSGQSNLKAFSLYSPAYSAPQPETDFETAAPQV